YYLPGFGTRGSGPPSPEPRVPNPGRSYTFSSRVFPGAPDTLAIRRPASAFKRLDLPTLDRPIRATSGRAGLSGASARGNEPMKRGSGAGAVRLLSSGARAP